MKIASNTITNNLDDFSPQSNNPVNSTTNKQPSTILNPNSQTNEPQNRSNQLSDKYKQFNSLESNYFKSLLNGALPNNKTTTSNQQLNSTTKSVDKTVTKPSNQVQYDASNKTETRLSKSFSNPAYDVNKIPGVKNNTNVTPEFLTKVDTVAKELETDQATLLAIISFETGAAFSSTKTNQSTGATGLIQFIPSTSRTLLTKTLKDPKVDPEDKKKIIDNLPVDQKTKEQLIKASNDIKDLPEKDKQLKIEINKLNLTAKDLTEKLNQARLKKFPPEQQEQIKSQLSQVLSQKAQLQKAQLQIFDQIKQIPTIIDSKVTKVVATETFKKMSNVEQLDYVKEYLLPYKGKLNNPQDAYLAVLFPEAVGKGSKPKATVFSKGTDYYEKNQGLDGIIDGKKDGVVTVGEATKKVTDFLKKAQQ